jgi:hypothetical protein
MCARSAAGTCPLQLQQLGGEEELPGSRDKGLQVVSQGNHGSLSCCGSALMDAWILAALLGAKEEAVVGHATPPQH